MSTGTALPPDAGYRVDYDGDDIVVRMRADLLSREDVSDFLDRMLMERLRRRASLTDEQIAALADEVDAAMWQRLRPMVEAKLRDH